MTTGLTREQYNFLLRPLAPSRVSQLKNQSHVEAWDIRRHLTRVFGFGGWDDEIIDCTLVHEHGVEKNGRVGWTVVYRVLLRLIIKDPAGTVIARYEDGATGDAINQPSIGDAHDMALKTAMSQALKRCAVNLGDQFGLSLYNKGQTGAVIGRTLVAPGEQQVDAASVAEVAEQDAPVVPESTPATPEEPTGPAPSAEREQPAAPSSDVPMVIQGQHKRMHALWTDLGYGGDHNRAVRLDVTSRIVNRQVESSASLTFAEANAVIEALETKKRELRARGEARATAGAAA